MVILTKKVKWAINIVRIFMNFVKFNVCNKRGIGMKRVITYGTFDLLHYGHINLLKRAKALGDYLIVAISTDEFNWNEKQKNVTLHMNRGKLW